MSLRNPAAFFDRVRAGLLGPTLSAGETAGCQAILAAMEGAPRSWAAYALATAYLETAHTMQPVKEMGGPAYYTRMYDIRGNRPDKARELGNLQPGDGAKFAGRGYVQLTGRTNYLRAEMELATPFVSKPDLALEPAHAAAIMRRGMEEGWFTGKRFSSYLPSGTLAGSVVGKEAFTQARRIINGQDRAADVAAYALEFQEALSLGLWG